MNGTCKIADTSLIHIPVDQGPDMTGVAGDSVAGVHEGNLPWQRDCCIHVVGVVYSPRCDCRWKSLLVSKNAFGILGCQFPQLPLVSYLVFDFE